MMTVRDETGGLPLGFGESGVGRFGTVVSVAVSDMKHELNLNEDC